MEYDNYMQLAINQAQKSLKSNDVPVGAVIVNEKGKVVAKAYNKKEKKQNPILHAEMIAITKAVKRVKNYRLTECTIVVTKEPCLMCMGAILSARLKTIVYGASDSRFGNIDLATKNNFNHKCNVVGGIKETECSQLLTSFFKDLRKNKK